MLWMRRGGNDVTRVVLATAEAATLDELAVAVPDRVAQLVGAWGGLLYRYDRGRIEPLGGRVAATIPDYRPELVQTDPTQLRARKLAPQPRVVLASRAVGRRAFERCAAYVDYYRRYDIERVTCMWLNDRPYATQGMVGMLLARDRHADEFDERDNAQLHEVLAALAAAVRRCERVEALRWRDEGLEAAAAVIDPYVVLDRDATAIWISPAARSLLGRDEVPEALAAAASKLLSGNATLLELDLALPGGSVRAALQLAGDEARRVCVARLEPMTRVVSATIAERLRERFGLTVAETRVLRLVALGLGNAAIAERCDVSIETVRTHVARVLAKLGVATRAQAGVTVWSFESD
jgi:DNA-binding CsgD family transcriptional regulator